MGKWAIIYSSVTGNTRTIAEAMAEALGDSAELYRVQDAPEDLSGYEVVLLGYWLRLGAPDPLMLRYLPKVHDACVCFFQTHGTDPGSEHAATAFARAGYHLGKGCDILGTFGCRGQINPALLEKRRKGDPDDPHNSEQSRARWKAAAGHPDDADKQAAKDFIAAMCRKLAYRSRFRAAAAARAQQQKNAAVPPQGQQQQ